MVMRLTGPRLCGGASFARGRCDAVVLFERVVLTTMADIPPVGTVRALSTV
jgi:hypothetical protein